MFDLRALDELETGLAQIGTKTTSHVDVVERAHVTRLETEKSCMSSQTLMRDSEQLFEAIAVAAE